MFSQYLLEYKRSNQRQFSTHGNVYIFFVVHIRHTVKGSNPEFISIQILSALRNPFLNTGGFEARVNRVFCKCM